MEPLVLFATKPRGLLRFSLARMHTHLLILRHGIRLLFVDLLRNYVTQGVASECAYNASDSSDDEIV